MRITKINYGSISNTETIKYKNIPVLLTFENPNEMDVFELNIHYFYTESTDKNVLTGFTMNESLVEYTDITTIAGDILKYVNACIAERSSGIREGFTISPQLYNYVDIIVHEALKKYKIEVEND